MALPHNLTAEQVNQVRDLVAQGNYGAAWNQLAAWGDYYADNAADVVGAPNSLYGEVMHELVKQHWENTAGPGAYKQYFNEVAETHLNNYLDTLATGYWPNTSEIEQSYRNAVTSVGLPPTTAIDGVITQSVGDATNGWVNWPLGLGIEPERVTPSNTFSDIDTNAAWEILRQDIVDTLNSFWDMGVKKFRDAVNALGDAIDLLPTDVKREVLHTDSLYSISILEQSVLDFESAEDAAAPPPPRRDPLTLDLDGDGIETIGVNAGAYFDHDGNGFAEQTGWVGADDGLLVWDRNSDGRINDGSELFGDQTRLQDGSLAANGFQALAEWDTNADGKIDSSDAVFANLKVWQDADGDGYSAASELKSLSDFGITGINLSYTAVSTPDGQGNTQVQAGTFTKTDGTTGALGGFEFNRDTLYTIQEEYLSVTPDIAALPDLRGYGNVYDLQQAMVRDATGSLKTLVESFVAETNPGNRNALLEQILFKWTGSDTIDPSSRGGNIDARKLAVLEKFYGRDAYDEKCNVYASPTALA